MSLFATKPISRIIAEAEETGEHTLKKALSALDLTMLGIGAIIGTGIFVLTGQAAGKHAGPAVIISMILAGIVSAFAALCYSEFAASVPISGSAYAYGYGTLGEFVAWIIGWDLILEYAFGAATVAVDRKSTRLNSSHVRISYAVFCLKKKTPPTTQREVRDMDTGRRADQHRTEQ